MINKAKVIKQIFEGKSVTKKVGGGGKLLREHCLIFYKESKNDIEKLITGKM